MRIEIRNRQKRRRVGLSRLKRVGEKTLYVLGRPRNEVSVLLVGDRAIRRLNQTYLNHDRSTDVLAFPQQKGSPSPQPHLLGDVVISVETAARQAKEHGYSLDQELALLLVHGILHLLGYDDTTPAARRRMWAKQARLLAIAYKEQS
ncbi:MAG: rRNA maturation RNase YbeY [candidate division NC10 bacterium]|nr:rRNA maturation RNase YbeY [candidate division NC10 bacterium]